jgi:hypothetical protein
LSGTGFAGDALPGDVVDIGDGLEREVSTEGGMDERTRKWMKAGGGEGGGESEGFGFLRWISGDDVGEDGIALGESAGFVDDEEFHLGKFLERGGVANQDAEPGGAGESAGGGDGSGESQRTGAGGDEDGDGAGDGEGRGFAGQDPADGGAEGEKKNDGGEYGGNFVGGALKGRGIFAGLFDQAGEAGDEGVGPGFFGEEEESAAGGEGAAEDRVADKFFDGQRFAGEDGLLDRGVAFENFSVGGDGFTGKDEEVLAGLDVRPGDDFFGGAGEESGRGRGEGEKVFEGSGQFIFRTLFDPLTGEDEGSDGGGGIEKEGWLVFFSKKYPK